MRSIKNGVMFEVLTAKNDFAHGYAQAITPSQNPGMSMKDNYDIEFKGHPHMVA